jgi:hypothetical protein
MTGMQIAKAPHGWASGGVSNYPLTHPIVGQGDFYGKFKQFIHLVDQEAEKFAHVYAIVAQWGVGKSRLGYELVSQINGTSPGWYLRNETGQLIQAELFDNDADREQYLGLYIRYGEIANDYHNVDNWFAFGLYKALTPLAEAKFDGSIGGAIAQEAYNRLFVQGFDTQQLAVALELEKQHSDQKLYEDPNLATDLCNAAFNYLKQFGINYVLIVLDELETAAETSTFGLEVQDLKPMDGRAIKLMGKAIKEEDPRRKLPWLRYVALCSPAIGDELREIQSTARRFEMQELAQNAFSDVSDFVRTLGEDGRLTQEYPRGLVEAAYSMSSGNFGWFNVIMANVDEVLRSWRGGTDPTVGNIFSKAVTVANRISEYVLDSVTIKELKLNDRSYLGAAQELLYGQLPRPLKDWEPQVQQVLLAVRNEYDEPAALLYRRVEWDELKISQALRDGKFRRDQNNAWLFAGVDQPLNPWQLLANLSTYAIYETGGNSLVDGRYTLLVPLRESEFVQLAGLLYPHPAVEAAARGIWKELVGQDLEPAMATHIGPSIAMLGRLNLRYRRQSQNSLIFRDPEQNAAFETVLANRKQQKEKDPREILTGIMRLIDKHWGYEPINAGFKDSPVAITTARNGLIECYPLMLHPDKRLILAWVRNIEDLERLCENAEAQWPEDSRTPVLAFTPSRALIESFTATAKDNSKLRNASRYLLLYQLSSSEEFILHQVGLSRTEWSGFKLDTQVFSTSFNNRLQSLLRPLIDEINYWRKRLNQEGRIAWPFRPSGVLKEADRELLIDTWVYMTVNGHTSLSALDEQSGINPEEIQALLPRLGVATKALNNGYGEDERAQLFERLDNTGQPAFPPFLVSLIERLLREPKYPWKFKVAEQEWFWGYTWDGAKPREIFQDWMALLCKLKFAHIPAQTTKEKIYSLLSRAELKGQIQEAQNWLAQDYPKAVQEMGVVFGTGVVQQYFGPVQGTKTRKADELLSEARRVLELIEFEEGVQFLNTQDVEVQKEILIRSSSRRQLLTKSIDTVFRSDKYSEVQADENIKALNLSSELTASDPLWRRIRLAKQFCEYVNRVSRKIREQIIEIDSYFRKETESLPGFPIKLFTLSLAKIDNILTGSLGQETVRGATQTMQRTESGTLGYFLGDLKIADASNKLSQLAREVGVEGSFQNLNVKPPAEVSGYISDGFRTLKKAYEQAAKQLVDLQNRLDKLKELLDDAPATFVYPKDVMTFQKLQARPALIQGTLEDLREEEADRLREDFDTASRLGNFQPLMSEVENLLIGSRRALQELSGQVLTLENAISGFRKRLLETPDLRYIETAFNALLKTQGKTSRPSLTLIDLERAGSLRAAVALLDERRVQWVEEGEALLAPVGVSFTTWQMLAEALEAGSDPNLDVQQAERLVDAGLLRRTYRLGGGHG